MPKKTHSYFIGTTNHRFAQRAQEELRRLDPHIQFETLVSGEVFIMSSPLAANDFVTLIKNNEPIFLRHMQPIQSQFPLIAGEHDMQVYETMLTPYLERMAGHRVAVQVRKTPDWQAPFSLGECRHHLQSVLSERHGVTTVAHSADWVLSIFLAASQAYIGLSHPADNLSDWSGGAIRFKKEAGQVSRSKFKLLEAEFAFSLDFSTYESALDVGAAPGGWTSLLLERGLAVTAVDPALLHPSLIDHHRLTYIQSNAQDVTFPTSQFDLLVCDMSWDPRQMSGLVVALLPALRSGGTAIITAKLMHGNAFQAIRNIISDLKPQLELVKAKQLFHNRQELTMYFIKL